MIGKSEVDGDSTGDQTQGLEDVMNDRCRGTLIGLAVGDALGAAVEFRSPGMAGLLIKTDSP